MLCNTRSFTYLSLISAALGFWFAFASCGKQNDASPGGLNVRLIINNLSPDLYPVDLYINTVKQNASSFSYNTTPAYFYLSTTNQPLQIRSTRNGGATLFTIDTALRSDTRYSLFVMGLVADSIYHVFLADDTTQLAPIGKGGKMRFINGSPGSTSFDIWANDTPVIKNVSFAKVSPYVILPAGSYTFRVYPAGTSTTDLASTGNITIQDGRLYTLYSKGLPNRANTDTARLSLGYIANN